MNYEIQDLKKVNYRLEQENNKQKQKNVKNYDKS